MAQILRSILNYVINLALDINKNPLGQSKAPELLVSAIHPFKSSVGYGNYTNFARKSQTRAHLQCSSDSMEPALFLTPCFYNAIKTKRGVRCPKIVKKNDTRTFQSRYIYDKYETGTCLLTVFEQAH